MHRIELSLKTVTPAFIGTADDAHPEWSAKGVRGQLRWWFRALAGGEFGGDLEKVRAAERNIFGSTDSQSPLRVIVVPPTPAAAPDRVPGRALDGEQIAALANTPESATRLKGRDLRTNPIAYLGYGPIVWRHGLTYARAPIPADTSLRMILQWRSNVDNALFERALWCWINLGGIGARSRRGFGSLVRHDTQKVADVQTFREGVANRLREAKKHGGTAAWTHFTAKALVYVSRNPFPSWESALEAAGAWMITFRRRYGIKTDERPDVRDRDYEWLKAAETPPEVPDRAGFGLPLPFGEQGGVIGWGREKHEGRRASPLLIHVSKFDSGKYHLVFTHIPAQLVPERTTLSFRGKTTDVTDAQKAIVQRFLEYLEGKKLLEPIGDTP